MTRFRSCLTALAMIASLAAAAQAPDAETRAAPPAASGSNAAPVPAAPRPAPASAETREARARLEAVRVQLDQAAASLQRLSATSDALQQVRNGIEPLADRLRQEVETVAPRLDAARARLDQLGPKPKTGEPAEGQDVARDRAEREAAVAELDETSRIARALLLQVEQQVSEISDRRRTAFNRALFERGYSLLDPSLWTSAAASLPRDLRAARTVAGDVVARWQAWATLASMLLLALALGVAIALHVVRNQLAPRLVRRDPARTGISRRRKLMIALGVLLVEVLPATVGAVAVYVVLETADLVPNRLESVAESLVASVIGITFLRGLAEAILAPGRPNWALLELPEAAASQAKTFVTILAATASATEIVNGLNAAIAASLTVSILSRALLAATSALVLAVWLHRVSQQKTREEACLGPYIPSEPEAGGPARIVGWAAVAVIGASLIGGYVAFASFLLEQLLWLGIVAALLFFLIALSDEFVGGSLSGQNRLSTAIQANTGLRRRSLEQLGVLASGLGRVVLSLGALLLVLVPWGYESDDLRSNLRSAFFGFKVGDVTISLSTVFVAILFFAIAVSLTRLVQRWLDKTFLPTTELDAGLRNSISTAAGYLGFFVSAALAFSYLGLSLDKIAIVAGALSVGIGFGLQSIVNNFVSGLILLWERPIRVGDLVVLGDSEGYVRRISVRATEIDTFDRSTVIVPNSNLISGVVKNRVRGDRSGRVVLPVAIGRDKDPARTVEVLLEQAARQEGVVAEPAPKVFFKKIGDASLEFELVCVVDDVAAQTRIQSELNFAVFAALVAAEIIPMPGPGVTTLGGLDPLRGGLEQIAQALASRGSREGGAGERRSEARPLLRGAGGS